MFKVSIIIPVYNKEKYLKRCFESLEEQIYRNLEIILIDDGSNDNSLYLCKEYSRISKYDCLVFHQENKGPSAARNKALEFASGDFVLFLDADDSLEQDCISTCIELFIRYKCDFVEFEFINEPAKKEFDAFNIITIENDEIVKHLLLKKYIKPVVCGAIYSRALLNNLRFPENMKWGEDSYYKLLICKKSNKIVYIKSPLYINYLVPNTLSRMECSEELLNSVCLLLDFYNEQLNDNNLDKELGRFIFNTAFAYISLILLQGKKELCMNGYINMRKYVHKYYKYADVYHKIAYNLMRCEKLYILTRKLCNRYGK